MESVSLNGGQTVGGMYMKTADIIENYGELL